MAVCEQGEPHRGDARRAQTGESNVSGIVVVLGIGMALTLGFLFGVASMREVRDIEGALEVADLAREQLSESEANAEPGFTEFAGFLDELGAEQTQGESELERALALRDTELEELRARLADLTTLGEKLGKAESELIQSRALSEELECKRERAATRLKKLQARWKVVPDDDRKAATRIAELEERLAKFKSDKRRLASQIRKFERAAQPHRERMERLGATLVTIRQRASRRVAQVAELKQQLALAQESAVAPALPGRLQDTLAAPRLGMSPGSLMQVNVDSAPLDSEPAMGTGPTAHA